MRRGIFRGPAEAKGITPGGRQPRFAGFDALSQLESWDATTAGVVLARLAPPPALRYFTPDEEAVGRHLFDQLLDQHDEPRVPILEMVDARLAEFATDGWRFAAMPEDGEAFKTSFAALDQDARTAFGNRFADLEWHDQADLIQTVQGHQGDWHGLPATDVWDLWTRYACTAFYSHPWAWNEMGFGGPAYPRGYKNIGIGTLESWEVADTSDEDPVGLGDQIEYARRRHAEARTRQLKAGNEADHEGVGDRLREQSP